MSEPLIFSIRPEPDCQIDTQKLRQTGIEAHALPLLACHSDHRALSDALFKAQQTPQSVLVLTSKQAAYLLAEEYDKNLRPDHTIWCVGRGSAAILKSTGYTHVQSANGTAQSLVQALIQDKTQISTKQIMWLSAHDISVDIIAPLTAASYSVNRQIIYQMRPLSPVHDLVSDALANSRPCGFMAMSLRTIEGLASWLAKARLVPDHRYISVIVQSSKQQAYAERLGFCVFCSAENSRSATLQRAISWAQNKDYEKRQ